MSDEAASRESILIAIIAAAGEDGLDRVQLQKSAFLVGEEFEGKLIDFYQFRPYMYGPFSQEIYTDVERLSDGPMIETYFDDGRQWYRMACDATSLQYSLSEDLESVVKRIVSWVSKMSSFYELVRAIYYLYPEQRKNSVLPYSEELAIEESIARSLRDMAAGRTRSVDDLIAELQT
ncbi:MAG: hypothetical protein OXG85_05400 [Chloroflexi bacterium]|nr:hypothetical protein [Chloroflexota bacterium]